MPKKHAKDGADPAVARLAARQHGVVTTRQLLLAGVLHSGIHDRQLSGRLHRIHRGVYAVGHTSIGNEGRWLAAVLACGNSAVLSHRSAGALWGIGPVPAVVEVTVPGSGGRAVRKGIRLHRSTTLSPADVTRRAGIPVTTPDRTLAGLHRVLSPDQFARALREAEYLKLPVGGLFETDRTRTDLEGRFLGLCRRHRLPRPEVNVRVDRFVVDFMWPKQHLIVEVDGWSSHRMRSAFESDRARDARLSILGYTVLRFNWRQIEEKPRRVASTVRTLLDR
jgi:very-short-patch-repair endonuclease